MARLWKTMERLPFRSIQHDFSEQKNFGWGETMSQSNQKSVKLGNTRRKGSFLIPQTQ